MSEPADTHKKPHTGGSPEHVPTADSRMIVKVASLAGLPQQRIARLIGVALATMRKHYAEELAEGGDGLMVKVVGTLAKIATDPKHPKAATAGIWLTRTRLGWKDGATAEPLDEGIENEGAGPVPKGTVFTLNLTGAKHLKVVGGDDGA